MRWVSARVFPLPAPAMTRSGPPMVLAASCCAGLSFVKISSVFNVSDFSRGEIGGWKLERIKWMESGVGNFKF